MNYPADPVGLPVEIVYEAATVGGHGRHERLYNEVVVVSEFTRFQLVDQQSRLWSSFITPTVEMGDVVARWPREANTGALGQLDE